MKKFVFSTMVFLSACQSFEAGGPAEGQCPKGSIDRGSGICRPLSSLSQQELFAARLSLDAEARSGTGGPDDASRAETENLIQAIIDSNRQQKINEAQGRSDMELSKNKSYVQTIGQRTTPVTSKRTNLNDFAHSISSRPGRN